MSLVLTKQRHRQGYLPFSGSNLCLCQSDLLTSGYNFCLQNAVCWFLCNYHILSWVLKSAATSCHGQWRFSWLCIWLLPHHPDSCFPGTFCHSAAHEAGCCSFYQLYSWKSLWEYLLPLLSELDLDKYRRTMQPDKRCLDVLVKAWTPVY